MNVMCKCNKTFPPMWLLVRLGEIYKIINLQGVNYDDCYTIV